jgi:hypothetical protein
MREKIEELLKELSNEQIRQIVNETIEEPKRNKRHSGTVYKEVKTCQI